MVVSIYQQPEVGCHLRIVAQLPSNYNICYQQRAEKNIKFVSYLRSFGFNELAGQIENDPSILVEEDFNATKTWTEYINRLIGVPIGILIFTTFVTSISYWKEIQNSNRSFISCICIGRLSRLDWFYCSKYKPQPMDDHLAYVVGFIQCLLADLCVLQIAQANY